MPKLYHYLFTTESFLNVCQFYVTFFVPFFLVGVDIGIIRLQKSLASKWSRPLRSVFAIATTHPDFNRKLKSIKLYTVGMGGCSEDMTCTVFKVFFKKNYNILNTRSYDEREEDGNPAAERKPLGVPPSHFVQTCGPDKPLDPTVGNTQTVCNSKNTSWFGLVY